ncbi:hypothetical protein [Streptococcus pluranimalium]|uniref:hypothetical protein n=1 Tax=Streptococcus pluranimalium TaxID=82348 RepID=UPI003F67618B
MSEHNPIRSSIERRIEQESYNGVGKKEKSTKINAQFLMLITIIIGLIMSLIKIFSFFWG